MSAQSSGGGLRRARYGELTLARSLPRCAPLSWRICSKSAKPLLHHWQSFLPLLKSKATSRVPLSLKCAFNSDLRLKQAKAAKADPAKQEESSENDVDALTFMQTVIMSFVRGMTHGEQILPINDLFVHLPVFFHECGRRVGGVPRSSLKGKETRNDEGEKNTSDPKQAKTHQTKTKTRNQKPPRPEADSPSSKRVSSVRG